MRKLYALAGAALLLGCMDDGSKATAPQLSGAVVGASLDEHGNGSANSNADDHDNGGPKLAVTFLSGAEEVPIRYHTHATADLTLRMGDDGQSINYVLDIENILNITQAHIHMAPRGVSGGIVVWLFPSATTRLLMPSGIGFLGRLRVEGSFTAADLTGALAGHPLSDFIAAVEAGNTYGNVHTNDGLNGPDTGPGDFPGGEIRGQLDFQGNGHGDDHGHDH